MYTQHAGSPPHVILGVSIGATPDEIRIAYRRLAKRWHPDRVKGDSKYATQQFTRIQGAYEAMSDPNYRYGRGGANPRGRPMGHPMGHPMGRPMGRPSNPNASVLCNGTVLMGGGFRPSDMTVDMLHQLQRNARGHR